MPYKSEKIKLSENQDRRRKLTSEQKECICKIYNTGVCGTRPLAKQFGVSRALIQTIVNPAISERHHKYVKEHWRSYCADNRERAGTMREHRHYKQLLYLKGELREDN